MVDDGAQPTERELREQLEHAEAIAHVGSWRWELASGLVTWSDELYRIFGLAPQARPITLEFFLSCVHPDERAAVQREIEAALQQRGPFRYREQIVRPDGELRMLDTAGEAVLDDAGNVTALCGTCRDVTDEARRDIRIRFYRDVFESLQVALSAWQVDRREDPPVLRLTAFNAATETIAGEPLAGRLGQSMAAIVPELAARDLPAFAGRLTGGASLKLAPFRFGDVPGAPFVAATLFALPGHHVGLALEDVTAQCRAQLLQAGERRALEMLAEGAPLPEILEVIVDAIEEVSPAGTVASILLLDETGTRMRHGAAPRLPEAYVRALDGTAIGPAAGSCGTAAYRRAPVYTADMATDPLWADHRELAGLSGFAACWSVPILTEEGKRVLGTFALYHREPRTPDAAARQLLERASHVTGIVLERRALDEQLRALAARLEAIREDERTAIARDIHDQLGQALTALKLDLAWLGRRLGPGGLGGGLGDGGLGATELGGKVDEMTRATDDIIRTVRRISADLRPGILDDIGLEAAIEWQAEEFEKRTGMRCRVRAEIGDLRLDRELATTVFRIFQESLTNVARHADAREVEVTLVLDHGQLRLEIADDGVGIPEVGPRNSTLGILGMGERARRLGGACTVKRRAPHGTIVTLVMPLRFPAERRGAGG